MLINVYIGDWFAGHYGSWPQAMAQARYCHALGYSAITFQLVD